MRRPQDEAALRVEPLGLERGRGDRGSKAVVVGFGARFVSDGPGI